MAEEHEILLSPVLSVVKNDNTKLINSLNQLAYQYDLKINLSFDAKKIEKQIASLQAKISKSNSVSFGDSKEIAVSTRLMSQATAEKLKQTLANQQLLADEKLRATVEQNNAKLEIANSKARIQQKTEEIKLSRLLTDEAERAAKASATLNTFKQNMSANVDALKLKGLSDSDISALDAFKTKVNAISTESGTASVQINALKREFAGLADTINRGKVVDLDLTGRTNMGELQNQLSKFYDAQVTVKQLNDEVAKGGNVWRTFTGEVKNADGTFTRLKGSINGSSGEVRVLESEIQKTQTATFNLGEAAKRAFATFFSVQQIIRIFKEGIGIINDTGNQMNALRMVTGATEQEAAKMLKTYQQLSKELSSTPLDVAKNADVWLRQGRSISETNELIRTTEVFAKDAAIDSAEAATLLTSAINGYKLEVGQAIDVVDKMTAVDMAAATSSEDLARAMSQTASGAKIAGVSLDTLLAYLGTVSDVTQKSAQSIGHSFSSMFARMQSVKLGADFDEFGDDVSKVETVLNRYNIALRDTPSTFRNLEDVIKDVSTAWQGWTDVQQREVATQLTGKMHMENFLVLMEHYTKVTDLQTVSLNSAGSAMERFNIYQESTAAKLSELSSDWQIFWANSIDSDTIQGFVEAGGTILDVLGDMGTALTLTTGLLLIFNRQKIGDGLGKLSNSIMSLIPNTTAWKTAQDAANTAMQTGARSAGAMGTALNSTLGYIGVAITLFSALKMAIDADNQAQEEARQRAEEAANAANKEIDALDELQTQYEAIIDSTATEAEKTAELDQWKKTLVETYGFEKEIIDEINLSREKSIELINAETIAAKKRALDQGIAGLGTQYDQAVQAMESPSPVGGALINAALNDNSLDNRKGGYSADKVIPQDVIDRLAELDFALNAVTQSNGKLAYSWQLSEGTLEEQKTQLEGVISYLSRLQSPTQAQSDLLGQLRVSYNAVSEEYEKFIGIYSEGTQLIAQKTVLEAFEAGKFAAVNSKEAYHELSNELMALAGSSEVLKQAIIDELASQFPQFAEGLTQAADASANAAKSAKEFFNDFSTAKTAFKDGALTSEEYTEALEAQLESIQKVIQANPQLAKSYENVINLIEAGIATAPSTLEAMRDAVLDTVDAAYTLSDAFAEQSENGKLSLETTLDLIDAGYAAAISIDAETGAVTINEEAYLALAEAKIAEQIASEQINRQALQTKLEDEQKAVENLTEAFYLMGEEAIGAALKAAQATLATTEAALVAKDATLAALEELRGNTSKVAAGKYTRPSSSRKSSSSAKAKKDEHLEAYKKLVKDIEYERDLNIINEAEYYDKLEALANEYLRGRDKYLDDFRAVEVKLHEYRKKLYEEERKAAIKAAEEQYKQQKEAAQDSYEAQKKAAEDSFKAQKKAAEDAYEAQRKALEKQKEALDDQLNHYKKLIDAKKQALKLDQEARGYESDVNESNKRIADLQADIAALSADDSEKTKAQRVLLQEELSKELNNLEELQYNRSVDLQEQALDDEYDRYKEHIDGQVKILDDHLEQLQERHEAAMDMMEASHDRYIDGLELSHDALMDSMEMSSDALIQSIESKYDILVNKAYQAASEISRAFASVADMQNHLMSSGFDLPRFGADGIIGPETVSALQRYLNQLGESLVVDGILGSKTSAAMKKHGLSFPTYHKGGIVLARKSRRMK